MYRQKKKKSHKQKHKFFTEKNGHVRIMEYKKKVFDYLECRLILSYIKVSSLYFCEIYHIRFFLCNCICFPYAFI